jgi:hypothetical protein
MRRPKHSSFRIAPPDSSTRTITALTEARQRASRFAQADAPQVIRRTIATLSQTKGTVKDTQGMMRHERLPTTTDVCMQVVSDRVTKMIDSIHEELCSAWENH